MNELECHSSWPNKTREYVAAPDHSANPAHGDTNRRNRRVVVYPAMRVALTIPYQRASVDALRNHVRMLIRVHDAACRTLPCSDNSR